MDKIFVTLAEAEKLIFNKILIIPRERLDVKRARGQFSIAIFADDKRLILCEKLIYVLISAVMSFQIPKDDRSIFTNHYKVPGGLIKAVVREVKDSPEREDVFPEVFEHDGIGALNIQHHKHLRRALLNVFNELLRNKDNVAMRESILTVMNQLVSLDGFARGLVLSVIDTQGFSRLEVKCDGFKPDIYFNWAWWGKYTRDNYLEKVDMIEEDKLAARKWLKQFDPTSFSIEDLGCVIASTPTQLKEISAVLIGYYLAFFFNDSRSIERAQSIKRTAEDDASAITEELPKITFWNAFFEGLCQDSIDYLYATKLVGDQFWEIDKRALRFATISSDDQLYPNITDILLPECTLADAAKAVYAARTHQDADQLIVINENNLMGALEDFFSDSPLYGKNKANVGIISEGEMKCKTINNYIFYKGKGFVLEQEDVFNPDLVFYGDFRNEIAPGSIKVKRKPFSALIPKGKKVFLFFLSNSFSDCLLDIYAACIKQHASIERVVVVWHVPYKSEELQTLQFDSEKAKRKAGYKKLFDKDVIVLAKSQFNTNHSEIIRLLRQSLESFKLKQVEVADVGFDESNAEWIIRATDHFLIANPNDNSVILNTF